MSALSEYYSDLVAGEVTSAVVTQRSQRYAEREAIAATFDYSQSGARRCADYAEPSDRYVSALGALIWAVNDDTVNRDDLKTLVTELDIACRFEVFL